MEGLKRDARATVTLPLPRVASCTVIAGSTCTIVAWQIQVGEPQSAAATGRAMPVRQLDRDHVDQVFDHHSGDGSVEVYLLTRVLVHRRRLGSILKALRMPSWLSCSSLVA